MNERLKTMIDKAALQTGTSPDRSLEPFLTAYTNEVIEECFRLIWLEAKWYWDEEEWDTADGIHHAARALRKLQKNVQQNQ